MQFNESAGGQVVFHLHFHILPRWTGVQVAETPGGPIASADRAPRAGGGENPGGASARRWARSQSSGDRIADRLQGYLPAWPLH